MIDFHAHLDLYPEPKRVVSECVTKGMFVLSVTTTASAWKGTSALAPAGSRVHTALGMHPQIAHERKGELDLFENYLPETPYVGEIGLDGATEFGMYWLDQINVFNQILEACSRAGGRIMSIHSRRAAKIVLERLAAFPNAGTPVLHWFSGNKRDLESAISMGCWFSVGPTMLGATKARELIARIPRERILTETDGPFAQVEGRKSMPWDVAQAILYLASFWNMPTKDVEQQLDSNLDQLVGSI